MNEIRNKTLKLLEQFNGKLPADRYECDRELIVAGEWEVALENLCQQLNDDSIPVDANTLKIIRDLAEEMKLPPKTWIFLTPN